MSLRKKLYKHFNEISLINFSKHQLVSPGTLQYADERKAIMGQAPNNTRLMDTKISGDDVRFTFYVYATDKYPDDHQYMDADPEKNFQLDRNDIGLYEIYLQFSGVNKLKNTSSTLSDIKNWIWEQDFKLYSNSPSFHWSGSNWKLSQLGGALYPTNIKPKKPSNMDRGPLDKHTFLFMLSIKWFVAQMSGSLLGKLRTQGYVSKYKRPPKTQVPAQQTGAMAQEPDTTDETGIPETDFDAKVQANLEEPQDNTEIVDMATSQPSVAPAPNPNTIANPSKKKPDPNAGLNADITKPQEKARNIYQGVLMQESVCYSRTPNGYEAKFKIDEKTFSLLVERNHSFLESSLTDFNSEKDRYFFESDKSMGWSERMQTAKASSKFTEIGIYLSGEHLSTLYERNQVKTTFNKILANIIEHDDFDIASLVLESGDDGFATLIMEIAKDWENVGFKTFNLIDSTNLVPRSFIFKEDSVFHSLFKTNLKEQDNATQRTLVMAYGSFSPPTSDHISFLRSMIATGEKANAEVLLFLQPNDEFETSASTLNQEQAILRSIDGLADLNVCLEEGIRDIYDALTFAYSELRFSKIILMCGSDQELAYQTMMDETNGKRTPNGFYKFDSAKVLSVGRPNPDKGQKAIDARNAILNGDFKHFIKSAGLPYVSSFKNLFDLLRYGAEEKIGV